MKVILLILDGLGDRSYPELGHRTPLEAAHTPNLDFLAQIGTNGLYHPFKAGVPLPSEIAHYLLLGYQWKDFPGRGYLEALGYGVPLSGKEVVLLARLLAVKEDLVVLKEKVEAEAEVFKALMKTISFYQEGPFSARLIPTKGSQGLLLLEGPVSPALTDSNPLYEGLPLAPVKACDEHSQAQENGPVSKPLSPLGPGGARAPSFKS